MRTLTMAVALAMLGTQQAPAQRPDSTRTDSTARARADSIRIVRELEAMMPPAAAVQAPQLRTAGAYMNIGLSALTDFGWSTERNVRSLQRGDHDPRVRGFTIPNAEIALDGAVDPYFKGFGNIVYKLDENGETGVELEEMFFLTTSLPGNLQQRAGSFSPSSAGRISSIPTPGRSSTSRWCSIASSAPKVCGVRGRGFPGWRRPRSTPRPW